MFPARSRTRASVERFFQFSLLGLVASGFFALAGSGYPDRATLIVTFLGLGIRAAMVAGVFQPRISPRDVSYAALAYVVFFPVDFYFISRDFLLATVHGVCFLAVVKILTARSNRDYIYTGVISFMELVAAAILSANSSFFLYLGLYVVCAIAVFTSAEIRRELETCARAAPLERSGIAWRLALMACAATAGILVLTAGLFLSVPRTARMAAMLFPGTPRLTGFSNVVDLGGFGKISRDDRPVMHILSDGRPLPAGLYWRGAALSEFNGIRWSESGGRETAIPALHNVAVVADKRQLSRRDGHRMLYRVEVQNSETGDLFIAGIPEFIDVDARYLIERPGESFRIAGQAKEIVSYQVSAHTGAPVFTPLSTEERAQYLRFPPIDMRIVSLARSWSGAGTDAERARRIENHLRRDFRYKLEGSAFPVHDPLADFLFVRKEGYCEYFASAMAVMLRSIGIPARVATGFYGGYYNEVSGLYVVRASDAHAWVEAWLDGLGWRTFDPTPASSETRGAGIFRRANMYLDAMDHAWQEWVVSYDLGHQAAVAARLETVLRGWRRPHLGSFAFPWKWLGWVLALTAGVFLAVRRMPRSRSQSGQSEAGILYSRMLAKLSRRGFQRPAWTTPAEFARQLPLAERARVAEFTELYNAARFGGDASALPRLGSLLKSL